MSFKSSYIYVFIIIASIILVRENFDFTTGDRDAYFYLTGWNSVRNIITGFIFKNLNIFGEILFSFLYYKNVFKLSSLLFLSTKLKNYFNSKLVYFSILLCLFAPVTLVFTSFAGKDIISIFLASELCIEIANYNYQKKSYRLNILKISKFIICTILLFIMRKLTGFFLLILLLNFIILFNKNKFKNLSLILFPISIIVLFYNWDFIYQVLNEELYYQWMASYTDNATFSSTNPDFNLDSFFKNSYQMITGISIIHFSESFTKASFLLFNSFSTFIFTIGLSLNYFLKNLKIRNLFFFKAFFLISFFILNGFLSQNNPGGAIRYMSSTIPIYTTFIFAVLPE